MSYSRIRSFLQSYILLCLFVSTRETNFVFITWIRNDAGLAAAELALAVEKHVLESGSIDTVGTVGKPCCLCN